MMATSVQSTHATVQVAVSTLLEIVMMETFVLQTRVILKQDALTSLHRLLSAMMEILVPQTHVWILSDVSMSMTLIVKSVPQPIAIRTPTNAKSSGARSQTIIFVTWRPILLLVILPLLRLLFTFASTRILRRDVKITTLVLRTDVMVPLDVRLHPLVAMITICAQAIRATQRLDVSTRL